MRHSTPVAPGTVITTKVPIGGVTVWHEGIVTDRYGSDGSRTVISHCKKGGTTIHEEMSEFHQGRGFEIVGYLGSLPPAEVLRRAWADVERRPAWTLSYNCQHAVRKWHGVPLESPQAQVAAGLLGVVALVTFVGVASRAA